MQAYNEFNSILRENAVDIHLSAGEAVQAPAQQADYIFDFARDEILQFQRVGDDLIIILNDGSSVRIMRYYQNTFENALVFSDVVEGGGISPIIAAGGAVLGLSALAMAAGGGGASGGTTTIETEAVGGDDNVVNADEREDGVSLSGSAVPGSQVIITIGNVAKETTADEDGNWNITFEALELPEGEKEVSVYVVATDPNGNEDEATGTITIDTLVNTLTLSDVPGNDDETVNAAEAVDGLNLTGEAEPGSTVVVYFNGNDYEANVDENGNWDVTIPPDRIPDSNGDQFPFSITATDPAGNARTLESMFRIDNQAPTAPIVEAIHQTLNGIDGVSTAIAEEGRVEFHQVSETGDIKDVVISQETTTLSSGRTDYSFANPIPVGADLILTTQDAAGNTHSTYQVFDNGTTGLEVSMNNASLQDSNINAINLFFADEAELLLTQEDIENLSNITDDLFVYGASDDTVTILGAVQESTSARDGYTFAEYSLGDATVWIAEDIPVVI